MDVTWDNHMKNCGPRLLKKPFYPLILFFNSKLREDIWIGLVEPGKVPPCLGWDLLWEKFIKRARPNDPQAMPILFIYFFLILLIVCLFHLIPHSRHTVPHEAALLLKWLLRWRWRWHVKWRIQILLQY